MRKCKGECRQEKPLNQFSENRHGNPMGKCKECVRIQQKLYRIFVLEPRRREEGRMTRQQQEREWLALPVHQRPARPCAIFPGYLFSGDVA